MRMIEFLLEKVQYKFDEYLGNNEFAIRLWLLGRGRLLDFLVDFVDLKVLLWRCWRMVFVRHI